MSVDLASILSNVNSASNVVLVNPQENIGILAQDTKNPNTSTVAGIIQRVGNVISPQSPVGFIFHVPGEDSIKLKSDITDHFVENNTSRQDHIALKPVVVNAAGYIGELNNVPPKALQPLKIVADRLTTLTPFLPALSASAIRAYDAAAQVYTAGLAAVNASVSAWSAIRGDTDSSAVQTKQQVAYNQFFAYWQARQLFRVQTPWAIFKDMAIDSLSATQDEETRMVTHFEISFKQMQFTQAIISVPDSQGRKAAQAAPQVDNGVTPGTPDVSLTAKIQQTLKVLRA